MITVGGDLVLAGANRPDPVDPHQPANTALAYSKPCLVTALRALPSAQLHRHARTAIAAYCLRICASTFMSPRDRRLVGRARQDR
jgi:hypothetical protein